MSASDCPSKPQLAAYLQGLLSEGEAEQLEAHLSACAECEKSLETADSVGRTLADAFRQSELEEDHYAAEDEFRQAVEAAERIAAEAARVAGPSVESTEDRPAAMSCACVAASRHRRAARPPPYRGRIRTSPTVGFGRYGHGL